MSKRKVNDRLAFDREHTMVTCSPALLQYMLAFFELSRQRDALMRRVKDSCGEKGSGSAQLMTDRGGYFHVRRRKVSQMATLRIAE